MDFEAFPKIARLSRDVVVTEKIDGTNAQVWISDDGTEIRAGSRNRYITPEQDNHGFARWVQENRDELLTMGPGRHFGEWWGAGIQRRYGINEKRFSLFNVHRWGEIRPSCCHVVPVLYRGPFDMAKVEDVLEGLRVGGSVAAPGCMKPEGIVIFHTHSGTLFKKILENDDAGKGHE